jgi:trigger factor
LDQIHIPASVSFIGEYAFFHCYSLKDIYVHATTPPAITSIVNAPGVTFHVPAQSLNAYLNDMEWRKYTIVGDPDVTVEKLDDEGVTLVAIAPVKPEVKISSYKGMKIQKFEYTVKDEEVDAEVARVQDRNARKIDVTDRAAQNGDIVNIDFVGTVDGVKYYLGNRELLPKDITLTELPKDIEEKGLIYFADEIQLVSVFAVEDCIKEDSKSAILEIQKRGIKTVMLTGDNFATAKSVAEKVGIDTFEGKFCPKINLNLLKNIGKKGISLQWLATE